MEKNNNLLFWFNIVYKWDRHDSTWFKFSKMKPVRINTIEFYDGNCHELNVCIPPNLYIEAPGPSVIDWDDKAFVKVIKIKWGQKGGPWSHWVSVHLRLPRRELLFLSLHLWREDAARRWPPASQEKSPRQEPNHLAPWPCTSQPPDREKSMSKPPACRVLLWQPS